MSAPRLRAAAAILLFAASAAAEEPPAETTPPKPPEGAARERLLKALPLPLVSVRLGFDISGVGQALSKVAESGAGSDVPDLEEASASAKASPANPDAWIRLASALENAERGEDARSAWSRAADLLRAPSAAGAEEETRLKRLGLSLLRSGRASEALPILERAAADPAGTREAHCRVAEAHRDQGLGRLLGSERVPRLADVGAILRQLLAARPGAESVAAWRDSIGRALKAADVAAKIDGQEAVVVLRASLHYERLMIEGALGNSEPAPSRRGLVQSLLSDLRELRSRNQANSRLRSAVFGLEAVGALHERSWSEGLPPEEVRRLIPDATALEKDAEGFAPSDRVEACTALAMFHFLAGSGVERVRGFVRTAAAAVPGDDRPWVVEAGPLLLARDVPAILELCERRLAVHESVHFRLVAAKACALSGRQDDAMRHAKAALGGAPSDGSARLMMAAVLARARKQELLPQAILLLRFVEDGEISLDRPEDQACAATLLGVILALQGRGAEGRRSVEKAIAIDGNYTSAREALQAISEASTR